MAASRGPGRGGREIGDDEPAEAGAAEEAAAVDVPHGGPNAAPGPGGSAEPEPEATGEE